MVSATGMGIAMPDSCVGKVEFYISGSKLKDLDVMSKSDPKCRVYMMTSPDTNWVKVGETETI